MLLVLCSQYTSRLRYTLDWIGSQWQVAFEITVDPEKFSRHDGAKINYHHQHQDTQALSISPSGFLYNSDLKNADVLSGRMGAMPVLFKDKSEIGFDVLSAVFYMLSRYEEYLPFDPDRHGRFPAQSSLAARHGFLDLPVADLWVAHLKKALQKQFPALLLRDNEFEAVFTYDIDVAYKYKGKNLWKNAAGLIRDVFTLSLKKVKARLGVISGAGRDPWDTYAAIANDLDGKNIRAVFFIPAGEHSLFDNNLSPQTPAVRGLLNKLKGYGQIGLHPSYYTTGKPMLISREKETLEKVLHEKVTVSRQHFLRFKLPDTYQFLAAAGIAADYSMAFADSPGFRAGTAQPFYFYDLKDEKQTALKLFPSVCMDQTFIQYLEYDGAKSLETMKALLRSVRDVNGVFIPIFHNHCLEDSHWRAVHKELIKEIHSL